MKDINHGGFIIELKNTIPHLKIAYEEGVVFTGNDDNIWFEIADIMIEDWISFIGFFGRSMDIENSDYLYAEYLEGLDE